MASFADRLKELRNEAGITQSALAEKLGIAMNTLSKWERGESQPNDESFISLCEYFGVPMTYLARVSDMREWPHLSDEEAAEMADAEEKEIDRNMFRFYKDLSYSSQGAVREVVAALYKNDRMGGKLQS